MTTEPVAPLAPPRRRRRVWPIVVVLVIVAVLVVAFFIADAVAKSYAENRIRTEITSALGASSSRDVTVDVGSGSILLQALSGHLDQVDVTIPTLSFGDLVGAASVHATDLPLDQSKPLKTMRITYTVGEKDLTVLAKNLSGVPIDSITLKQPDIVATATVKVSVLSIPVSLALQPSTSAGRLVFTPSSVTAAGQTFTTEQLTSNPVLGSAAKQLLKQQSFCVAQYLPKALTTTGAGVRGKTVILTFDGDGAVLDRLSTKGTCS